MIIVIERSESCTWCWIVLLWFSDKYPLQNIPRHIFKDKFFQEILMKSQIFPDSIFWREIYWNGGTFFRSVGGASLWLAGKGGATSFHFSLIFADWIGGILRWKRGWLSASQQSWWRRHCLLVANTIRFCPLFEVLRCVSMAPFTDAVEHAHKLHVHAHAYTYEAAALCAMRTCA